MRKTAGKVGQADLEEEEGTAHPEEAIRVDGTQAVVGTDPGQTPSLMDEADILVSMASTRGSNNRTKERTRSKDRPASISADHKVKAFHNKEMATSVGCRQWQSQRQRLWDCLN